MTDHAQTPRGRLKAPPLALLPLYMHTGISHYFILCAGKGELKRRPPLLASSPNGFVPRFARNNLKIGYC